jgi:hypothetical protein
VWTIKFVSKGIICNEDDFMGYGRIVSFHGVEHDFAHAEMIFL